MFRNLVLFDLFHKSDRETAFGTHAEDHQGARTMLVGYARVSTLDQNPILQIEALREAGCEQIYTEKVSGARRDRPEFQAALTYLRKGDTLVVWKLSRLARSLRQVIETVYVLQERGIDLRALTQNIDTGTTEGRLFLHIMAAFDEFQREIIVENTQAGLEAAARQGRKGGRPPAMDETRIRQAEAMIRDTVNYPFISDVIRQLEIGRSAFYRYFPPAAHPNADPNSARRSTASQRPDNSAPYNPDP